jgi:hypothetical protein
MPNIIVVFFDLQDNPVDSPARFFRHWPANARKQAWWY